MTKLNTACESEFREKFHNVSCLNRTNKKLDEISNLIRGMVSEEYRGKYTLTYFDIKTDDGYHFFDVATLNDIMSEYIKPERQHYFIHPQELITHLIKQKLKYSRSLTKRSVEKKCIAHSKWADVDYINENPFFYIGAVNFHASDSYSILTLSAPVNDRHALSIGIKRELSEGFFNELETHQKRIENLFIKVSKITLRDVFRRFCRAVTPDELSVGISAGIPSTTAKYKFKK